MDKNQIAFLKRRFPSLFYKVAGSYVFARLATEADRLNYVKCLMLKRPYFGTVMLAGQTWESRKPFMRKLIAEEIATKGPENGFHVLEMGSWAGDSAVLWARAMKEKEVRNGTVTCVDAWEACALDKDVAGINKASLIMDRAARRGKIFKLFLHNIQAARCGDIVRPLKGLTRDVLPGLPPRSFDLVYVDASHLYSQVLHDLRWALKLVKLGGVICGDDLEFQKQEIDAGHAEANKERDMVLCPLTGREYHPGVTLAVAEVFQGQVICQGGFWHAKL